MPPGRDTQLVLPNVTERMSAQEVELVMVFMMRNVEVLRYGLQQLTPQAFQVALGLPHLEAGFQLIFQAMSDYYQTTGLLPNPLAIQHLVQGLVESGRTQFPVARLPELGSFFRYAYEDAPATAVADTRTGLAMVQRFAKERVCFDELFRKVQSAAIRQQPLDNYEEITALIDKHRQLSHTALLAERPPVTFSLEDHYAPAEDGSYAARPDVLPNTILTPTGTFLDQHITGVAPGSVNCAIGAIGGGKTMLLCMLAVGHVLQQIGRAARGEPTSMVVLATYEVTEQEILNRILSCAARIDYGTLLNRAALSQGTNLKPYERTLFAAELRRGQQVLAEADRWRMIEQPLNQYVAVLDFSGFNPLYPGNGYVPELTSALTRLQETRQQSVGLVLVDYAKRMIDRYTEISTYNQAKYQFLFSSVVGAIKDQIAKPFNCPVWLAQQLTGEANGFKPGRALTKADCFGSKTFTENAEVAVMMGTKDKRTSAVLFTFDKTRNTVTPPPLVCRLVGELQTFMPAGDEFVVSPTLELAERQAHTAIYGEEFPASDRRSAVSEAMRESLL